MNMIEQIKTDVERGRGNKWRLLDTMGSVTVMDGTCEVLSYHYSPCRENRANASRIARVPDMEAALLAADRFVTAYAVYECRANKDLPEDWEAMGKALSAYYLAIGEE